MTDARSPGSADHVNQPLVRREIFTRSSIVANNTCGMRHPKKPFLTNNSYLYVTTPTHPPLAMDLKDAQQGKELLHNAMNHLKTKRKVLLLTTSNRWGGQEEKPKSTRLAHRIAGELQRSGVHATLIDVPKLTIHPCEGNVSDSSGNNCGLKKAILKDKNKNPSGHHRCWASINNADDELWKITKELFTSDCVVFFASVRWGALNSYYQKLIERLTWIENLHSTLGEENIVAGIEAGLMVIGQNWNGENAFETQKKVLEYFGFDVNQKICWNWQYTQDAGDETNESYIKATKEFEGIFLE
jgi:multimeric flavodoxin WrbA